MKSMSKESKHVHVYGGTAERVQWRFTFIACKHLLLVWWVYHLQISYFRDIPCVKNQKIFFPKWIWLTEMAIFSQLYNKSVYPSHKTGEYYLSRLEIYIIYEFHLLQPKQLTSQCNEWRLTSCCGMPGYTWCDAKNEPKSRVDYVFINESFFYSISDIKARKIPGTHSNGCRMSDHRF